ncbi:MAG: PQQ-like beta-propeller repeat protein [Planctomycetes bacterium]|nr:PQQ-like beta-propeller repeat protein [Planctomycetota bacterium]
MPRSFAISIIALLLCAAAARAEVSGWRGDGTGRYPNATPPIEWNEKTKPKWTAEVGKTGYAMPVVMGERVLVACEPDELYCVNLADGKVLWHKKIAVADLPADDQKKVSARVGATGNFCATPVCDGKFVYAVLGSGLVACFDAEGNRQWLKFIDQQMTLEHGRSAAPLLAGGKLIVQLAYLTALDPKDGHLLWEAKDAECNYGSPVAAKIGDVDLAITPLGAVVRVSDGKVLAKGIGTTTNTSPIVQDGVVYFIEVGTVAVQLPDKVTDDFKPKELWTDSIEGETFASPVFHDGLLYSMNNQAALRVLDAKTGKLLYSKETEIPVAGKTPKNCNIYPSPVLAGKNLYFSNDQGDTFVVETGKEYKEVKRNTMSSGAGGCIAVTAKGLLLRGDGILTYIEP